MGSRSHGAAAALPSDDPPLELLTRWGCQLLPNWSNQCFPWISSQRSARASRQSWSRVRYLVKLAGWRHLPSWKPCQVPNNVSLVSFCHCSFFLPGSAKLSGFFSLWLWGLYWRLSTRWGRKQTRLRVSLAFNLSVSAKPGLCIYLGSFRSYWHLPEAFQSLGLIWPFQFYIGESGVLPFLLLLPLLMVSGHLHLPSLRFSTSCPCNHFNFHRFTPGQLPCSQLPSCCVGLTRPKLHCSQGRIGLVVTRKHYEDDMKLWWGGGAIDDDQSSDDAAVGIHITRKLILVVII